MTKISEVVATTPTTKTVKTVKKPTVKPVKNDVSITIMQNLKNGMVTKFDYNLKDVQTETLNKVLGTCLYDFFKLIDMQKAKHVNLFKLNEPFDLIIKTDKITVDTTKINRSLKTKFKLNATAKRKRNFAKTVHALVTYSTAKVVVKTVEQVINELPNE